MTARHQGRVFCRLSLVTWVFVCLCPRPRRVAVLLCVYGTCNSARISYLAQRASPYRVVRVRKLVGYIVGAVGFVAAVLAIVQNADAIWQWLYPVPLIVGLAAALVGSWVYFWTAHASPSAEDQRRLDRLLKALPREATRRLESQDFVAPWPERSVYPTQFYVNELDGPEDHFASRRLEKKRRRLYESAVSFIEADAWKGFPHPMREGFRNTGWTIGELEEDTEKARMAKERAAELQSLAAEALDAHEALVKEARREGYSLAASESVAPEEEPLMITPRAASEGE